MPPTLEEALQLHARASANLDHICTKIRNATKTPALKDIYLGNYRIDCAPADMSPARLSTPHRQPPHQNYGIDQGHTFNTYLKQIRMNIIVVSLV
jgi:hypothetical protein